MAFWSKAKFFGCVRSVYIMLYMEMFTPFLVVKIQFWVRLYGNFQALKKKI